MATRDLSMGVGGAEELVPVQSSAEKAMAAGGGREQKQSLFVMRHGERLDSVDYRWVERSPRPYDPPLTKKGEKQAKDTTEYFQDKNIETVVSSPFLRCLQTGQIVCDTLQLPGMVTSNEVMDVLNSSAFIHWQPEVPADNIASYGIKVVSMDTTPVPRYPEETRAGLKRIEREFQRLADKYYPQNIVVISHGYGVTQAISMCVGNRHGNADYCGCVELCRTSKTSSEWKLNYYNKQIYI